MSAHSETTLYTQVPDALVDRYGLTVACVYGRIRRYARTQACTARLKTIAEELRLDERTVRRSVETLEAGGYLRVSRARGHTNTIRLSGRLRFAESADTETVEVADATSDTVSAPASDIMSAPVANLGHSVRTTSDIVSALPRTSCPDTSDMMSGRIKRQVKKQSKETNQETSEEVAGASARPAASKPRKPTPHQLMFQAVCDAAGLEPRVLAEETSKGVARLAKSLRDDFEATPDDVAACSAAWYTERWRGRAASTVNPPSLKQLREWFGAWRKRRSDAISADPNAKYAGWVR